jgi:hypothetical protein
MRPFRLPTLIFSTTLSALPVMLALALTLPSPAARAKLAPLTPAEQAAAAETAAKEAWNNKVQAFQLCKAADRVAERYRADTKAAGKEPPQPTPTPPCTEPGPYNSPVLAAGAKPLESSGAHSPPSPAASPPSSTVPQAAGK